MNGTFLPESIGKLRFNRTYVLVFPHKQQVYQPNYELNVKYRIFYHVSLCALRPSACHLKNKLAPPEKENVAFFPWVGLFFFCMAHRSGLVPVALVRATCSLNVRSCFA